MRRDLSRSELVDLVQQIMAATGTEEDHMDMIALLEANVPHPRVSDLIYYPKHEEPTAESVVDEALMYKPISL